MAMLFRMLTVKKTKFDHVGDVPISVEIGGAGIAG